MQINDSFLSISSSSELRMAKERILSTLYLSFKSNLIVFMYVCIFFIKNNYLKTYVLSLWTL